MKEPGSARDAALSGVMTEPSELSDVLAKLPWVPIGLATAVVLFSILGLRWLQQHTRDEDEQMALLDKAFAESAEELDPAAQPGFYGGWTDEYFWNQGKEEVEVLIWVPQDTKAKEIRVDVTSTTLDVVVKGNPVISGDLDAAVQGSSPHGVWRLELPGPHQRLGIGTETVWYLERDVQGSAKPPPKHIAVVITLQKKMRCVAMLRSRCETKEPNLQLFLPLSTDPKTHWTCLINGDDSRKA